MQLANLILNVIEVIMLAVIFGAAIKANKEEG